MIIHVHPDNLDAARQQQADAPCTVVIANANCPRTESWIIFNHGGKEVQPYSQSAITPP